VRGELQILEHFLSLREEVIGQLPLANSTERAMIIEGERAVFVPFGGRNKRQHAATSSNRRQLATWQRRMPLSNKKQQAATPGNRQQLDWHPAVNRRDAGSNPA
jgi:hypothetical protein